MSDDVLIKVENVSKKFCKSLKQSMLYGIEDIARDALNLKTASNDLRKDEFWAVDDVSFEVKRGECLGVIGRNGAGKSTLLKMLNGIFMPDKGKITIKGKVGALIEVGAGFHPMLTGRENIYVNGSILGMSKKEIDNKFDEIVEFAELEEFIDMPVKHYSSGMYVRLGFSIATQVRPDVLILDEILAVGDAGFRAKSFNKIAKILGNSAVIFVSHSMPHVARIATKTLLLEKGKSSYYGEKTTQGVSDYIKLTARAVETEQYNYEDTHIKDVQLNGKVGNISIIQEDKLTLSFKVHIDVKYNNPEMMMVICNDDYSNIVQVSSPYGGLKGNSNERTVEVSLSDLVLNPGYYMITLAILDKPNGMILARYNNYCQFSVSGGRVGFAPVLYEGKWHVF